MWSHLYGYYKIRGTADYRVFAGTKDVRIVLDGFPELRRIGLISYENAADYPWISLSLVKSNEGNYNISSDTWSAEFNMIPIICSKSDNGRVPASQVGLLIKIAAILNWELIEEETDDSDEEVVLYRPA